jgi:hypothetical protein
MPTIYDVIPVDSDRMKTIVNLKNALGRGMIFARDLYDNFSENKGDHELDQSIIMDIEPYFRFKIRPEGKFVFFDGKDYPEMEFEILENKAKNWEQNLDKEQKLYLSLIVRQYIPSAGG